MALRLLTSEQRLCKENELCRPEPNTRDSAKVRPFTQSLAADVCCGGLLQQIFINWCL